MAQSTAGPLAAFGIIALALIGCGGWNAHPAGREPAFVPSVASPGATPMVGATAANGAAAGWDGRVCRESPVSGDGIERNGSGVAARMPAGYPSLITIPTAGCWRLTAHLGSTSTGVTIDVPG